MKRYAIKSKSGFLSPLRVFGRGIATKSNEVYAVRLTAKPHFTYTLKSEAKHDVAAYRAFVKETFKYLTLDSEQFLIRRALKRITMLKNQLGSVQIVEV